MDRARGTPTLHSAVWIALVLSLLLNLRQIAYLAVLQNRYMTHWRRSDALVIITTIFISACVIFGVHELLQRAGSEAIRRLRTPFLALILLTGAITLLSYLAVPPEALSIAWGAGLVLGVAPSYFFATERIHNALTRAGLVLVPVVLATFAQMLWWSPWGTAPDPLEAGGTPGTSGAPVYFLLFDEWSYEQSVGQGDFRPHLPNLRRLAKQSLFFQRAFSPAADTEVSLPSLLFRKDESWQFGKVDASAYWERDGERTATRESPTLFSPFALAGYRTALLGYYLPYRHLIGPSVDAIRTTPHVPAGRTFGERLADRTLKSARFLIGPGMRSYFQDAYKRRYSRYWFDINENIFRDTRRVIAEWPSNTFLFVHWPLPHAPFVFNADGSYRGPFTEGRTQGSFEDYERSLTNMDRIVGELVAALRARESFDDALVIMTSDHGWKLHDRAARRVPLLIKWPHQRKRVDVEGVYQTLQLGALLERFAAGGMTLEMARESIEAAAVPIR